MPNEPVLLRTLVGFLDEFVQQHLERQERPFCFLLGAGASKQSDIPLGCELARRWLDDLFQQENFDGLTIEEWASAQRLGIDGFKHDTPGDFYPGLYQRRFRDCEDAGYAFLENQMEGKEPSFGYSVLAYLLSETQHKIAITTNFDNLIADALSIHSNRFPLVVGHDSLAGHARSELRRPLVAKIHGALGFVPKNRPEQVKQLGPRWRGPLQRIFERYTPIVIGYNGCDGSVMGFLESLPKHAPERVFWCFHDPDNDPVRAAAQLPDRIIRFVVKRNGWLVPIPGFDELMLMIYQKLRTRATVPDLFDRLKARTEQRIRDYDLQQQTLAKRISALAKPRLAAAVTTPVSSEQREATQLLNEAVGALGRTRKQRPWWVWEEEAQAAGDMEEKEKIYRRALDATPDSFELVTLFTAFLERFRDKPDEAEHIYERALNLAPQDPRLILSFATFLWSRRNLERADDCYRRALDMDATRADATAQYATFLFLARRDYDRAEQLFRRAVELEPDNWFILSHWASFLYFARGATQRADTLFRKAIEIDPENPAPPVNYAHMLFNEGRKDLASEYSARAESRLESRLEAHSVSDSELLTEVTFYRLAHLPDAWPGRLTRMRELIAKGGRSPYWPLERDIAAAKRANHPDVPLLRALADVISNGADPTELDVFPNWTAAK